MARFTIRFTLIVAIVCAASMASAQSVRRGPVVNECPEPDSWTCQMWPHLCEGCVPEYGPVRRVGPRRPPIDRNLRSYLMPQTIGVMQLAYEYGWNAWSNPVPHPYSLWTTDELLDDIASYGFNGAKIWMAGDPFDGTGSWCWSPSYWDEETNGPFSCQMGDAGLSDMDKVFRHPAFDVLVIRFVSDCWSIQEHNARGPNDPPKLSGRTFANEPTFDIARTMLERYGDIDKWIVFSDWETDWHSRGQNSRGYDADGNMLFPWDDAPSWYSDECWDLYGYQECGEMLVLERWVYVLETIQRRQRDIERARALFPRARLRVVHELIVNRYPGNMTETDLGYYLVPIIDGLEFRPDYIGISFWDRDVSIRDVIQWIMDETHYPAARIIIDEFGEWRERYQYERIWNEGRQALCMGVRNINVWMWRQTWCATTGGGALKNHGMFNQLNCPKPSDNPQEPVQFGNPRPGLDALIDLQSFVPNEIDCEEILNLPPTRPKSDVVGRDDEKSYPWEVYDDGR